MDEKASTHAEDEVVDKVWQAEVERAQIQHDAERLQSRDFNPYEYAGKLFLKICLGTLLFVSLWVGWIYTDNALLPFSAHAWKDAGKSSAAVSKRQRYVGRLRRQHQLLGKNKAEITQLLGKPTKVEEETWIYNCGSFGFMNHMLFEIGFKNGRVITHEIRKIHN